MKAKVTVPNWKGLHKRQPPLATSERMANVATFDDLFNRCGNAKDLLFLAVGIVGSLVEAANNGSAKAKCSLQGLANVCRHLGVKREGKMDAPASQVPLDDKEVEPFVMTALAVLGRLIQQADKGSAVAEKALHNLTLICSAVRMGTNAKSR